MTAQDRIREYYDARADYERIHEMSSAAYARMKRLEYEAVDAMLAENVKSIGRDDGTHVSLRKQFTCSVTVENEEAIRSWLLDVMGDDTQFIVEKVHKPALLEWLKGQFEETMDEGDVPDFLKLNTHPGLTVRGWKTRNPENTKT